jgi:response regulator of citrate/malate metabolism
MVGLAQGLSEAVGHGGGLGPDLVLLDLYFPEGNAWSCCAGSGPRAWRPT